MTLAEGIFYGLAMLWGFCIGVISTAWAGLILFEGSCLRKKQNPGAGICIKARD